MSEPHDDKEDSPACDVTAFRSLLGAVMQLVDCRPDIAFTVAKISQRQCYLGLTIKRRSLVVYS